MKLGRSGSGEYPDSAPLARRPETPVENRPAPVITLTLFVPGRLVSKNGGRLSHWAHRAAWAKEWRRKTRLAWLEAGRPTLSGPAKVTLTLYVGRLWDRANLAAGVAPVQDEAMYLMCEGGATRVGRDGRVQRVAPDGPGDRHLIHHRQEVRVGRRGVLVEIESLGGA